jgi:NAD(P)-dependent dehydrogenase (short-subunit alcohol dehydrogenase family)
MKNVIITGASGSLGSAVVERFLEASWRVIAVDREPNAATADSAHHLSADLSDFDAVENLFTEVDKLGEVDAVVHCAGGFRFSNTDQISNDDIDFLLNANFKSSVLVARESLKRLKASGRGQLVFISSVTSLGPGAGVGVYGASKAAINALVDGIAAEVKDSGINVHAVLPSIIDTAPNRKDMPDADHDTWVKTQDLAEAIFALTTPAFKAVRKSLIPVTAGT